MSNEESVKDRVMEPTQDAEPAGPCAMVIFGAGGDLTKRLVVPALYNLARSGQLSEGFQLVGVDLAPLARDREQGVLELRRLQHAEDQMAADIVQPLGCDGRRFSTCQHIEREAGDLSITDTPFDLIDLGFDGINGPF